MPKAARRTIVKQIVASVIALAIAVVGYVTLIPVKVLDGNRLTNYVVTSPKLPGVQPAASFTGFIPTTGSPINALLKASAVDAYQTGGASSYWYGPPATADEANVLLEVLPTAAYAKAFQTQESAELFSDASLAKAGYKLESRGVLAAFPGSVTASFLEPRKTVKPDPDEPAPPTPAKPVSKKPVPAIASLYRVGRFVVVEQFEGAPATMASIARVAGLERSEVQKIPRLFTLEQTNWPVGSSIVLIVLAVLALAAVWSGPPMWSREKSRREARALARERYQYRVRGSKTLKRGRAQI